MAIDSQLEADLMPYAQVEIEYNASSTAKHHKFTRLIADSLFCLLVLEAVVKRKAVNWEYPRSSYNF